MEFQTLKSFISEMLILTTWLNQHNISNIDLHDVGSFTVTVHPTDLMSCDPTDVLPDQAFELYFNSFHEFISTDLSTMVNSHG